MRKRKSLRMKFLSKSVETDFNKISDSLKRIEAEQIGQRIDLSRVINMLRKLDKNSADHTSTPIEDLQE